MALLYPTPCKSSDFEARDSGLCVLQAISDALPPGELVGALLTFTVKDGLAHYRVTDGNPLTVQHVETEPYGDDYTIPKAHVRGLALEDVFEQLDARRCRRTGAQRR